MTVLNCVWFKKKIFLREDTHETCFFTQLYWELSLVLLEYSFPQSIGPRVLSLASWPEKKGIYLDRIESEAMIPPKLLVYRRTHGDACVETRHETRRRKKSCGELFQNGYRVRQGHRGQGMKGRRTGPHHSVCSCVQVLCSWGKGVHVRLRCALISKPELIKTLKLFYNYSWLVETSLRRCRC